MPRPDPAPHSNPAASEEALELSAGVNDAIPDVMSVEKNDSTDSRFSDRKREPILATLAAVATLPANGGPTLSVNAIPTAAINPTLLEPDESADEKPEKKGLIRSVVGVLSDNYPETLNKAIVFPIGSYVGHGHHVTPR